VIANSEQVPEPPHEEETVEWDLYLVDPSREGARPRVSSENDELDWSWDWDLVIDPERPSVVSADEEAEWVGNEPSLTTSEDGSDVKPNPHAEALAETDPDPESRASATHQAGDGPTINGQGENGDDPTGPVEEQQPQEDRTSSKV
jgi:hypothetical protein